MYGLLAMLVLVTIVEVPDSLVGRKPMVSIPILMWLWANSHGTFAIGFGYLFVHLAGQWLDGRPPTPANEREQALLRASVLGGVVTLANPYFFDLLLFPLALMGRGEVLLDVQEWQSPNFRELGGYFFAAVIVMTIAVLARRTPSRRAVRLFALLLVSAGPLRRWSQMRESRSSIADPSRAVAGSSAGSFRMGSYGRRAPTARPRTRRPAVRRLRSTGRRPRGPGGAAGARP